MKKTKTYDIFISYRRSSYDTANLIATRLKAEGFSVFFDMETLRSGKFNEQLLEVIDNCKDFIVVLPPGALDRCKNEDDWVRIEVCRAMAENKNIVPVMLNGFTWPDPMPVGMEELCEYQALTASSVEYFDLAMERLQQRYLNSRPHLKSRKMIKIVGIFSACLMVAGVLTYGIFLLLSRDVCLRYATDLVKDAGYVHMIAEDNNGLQKDWERFVEEMAHEHRRLRIEGLQEMMLSRVESVEANLTRMWDVDTVELEIGTYHRFLLSLHGINSEEISSSPVFATMYYKDYMDQLNSIRNAVIDPSTFNRRFVSMTFEVFEHTINSYYAAILSELSFFPKSSLRTFNELSPYWKYFPKHYMVGADREYYEDIINTEGDLAEEVISRYEAVLEQKDAEIEDVWRKNEELSMQMDTTVAVLSAVAKMQHDARQELAVRSEKVAAQTLEVEASKAELEELDRKYVEVYESLKKKCTIEESDDQWYQWGKICKWGNFLSLIVESRHSMEQQGVYSTSSVTPEMAFAEMNSLLTVYQTYHPESADYVAASKLFFREIVKKKRPYSGILIVGFKDDLSHPIFRKGDIVVAYNDATVKTYADFKAAYQSDKDGIVRFIRVDNGNFMEFEEKISDTDIVGFVELTE